MALPLLIRMAHEPEFRTSTIGRYADGQFFGSVHGSDLDDADGITVMLHVFDHVGRHVRSDIRPSVPLDSARPMLLAMIGELADVAYGDIAIRLFDASVDGVAIGLFDESDDERGDWAELLPQWLGFGPPFDGLYDT